MQHNFSQVPSVSIPRSQFRRNSGRKTTFDAGYLVPIFIDEIYPGDTMHMRSSSFLRLATPIVPIMDNMFFDTFWFFVPYRLVWDNWKKFHGEQANPNSSTDFTVPQIEVAGAGPWKTQSLADYLGLPVDDTTNGLQGSFAAFPFRIYNLIYNEWFRNQNLLDSVVVDKDDGPDNPTDYSLLRRMKRPDYFTTCLPWPQKSDSIEMPFTIPTTVPVQLVPTATNSNAMLVKVAATDALAVTQDLYADNTGKLNRTDGAAPYVLDPNSRLTVPFTGLAAGTINALRTAVQLQRVYERDARGGTRYTEIIRSHFGVISPDARLQRPEYLGGSSNPINVTPIAQTSSTDATTPQGNLAAFGTVSQSGSGFHKGFTEHGMIMGICNVRADLSYWQGVDRHWRRLTRFDYYYPGFAHIGEQAVLNEEIYYQGIPASDDEVFGYQERFGELRYKKSEITGKFRGNATGSLEYWHLAQKFTAQPTLNGAFINEDPPVDRVIATPDEPHFIGDFYFDYKCARPMPMFGVPGMMDHF